MPKVTVVMPVYNGRIEWLKAAVQSILDQTWSDFEFYIIDDGSDDSHITSFLFHLGEAEGVRVFRRSHAGLASSLNYALEYANGQYFARMDADDIAYPERLQKQVAFLDRHPEVVLVGAWVELVGEDGNTVGLVRTVTGHDAIVRELRRRNNPIAHPTVMIRTDVLRAVGGYSDRYGAAEDYELWTRIVDAGQVAILNSVLLKYRLSRDSVSHSNVEENYRHLWLAWKAWQLRQRGIKDAHEEALRALGRLSAFQVRKFKAEALRGQASRMRLLGYKDEARQLLADAWHSAPWDPIYPMLLITTFVR